MTRLESLICVTFAALLAGVFSCGVPENVRYRCEVGGICRAGYSCVDDHCVPDAGTDAGGDDDDAGGADDGGDEDAGGDAGTDAGGDGDGDAGDTDAGTDAGAPASAPIPLTWSGATALTELNTSANERHPTVTADGLRICFIRKSGTNLEEVWCAKRAATDQQFEPELEETSLPAVTVDMPELSASGMELFFTAPDGGGANYGDFFWAKRPSATGLFSDYEYLPTLSSAIWDLSASVTADGLTMIFQSDRQGTDGREIWQATRESADTREFSAPVRLMAVNSPQEERDPTISPDGGYLVFWSNDRDSGGLTGAVIWIAGRLEDGGWATPRAAVVGGLDKEIQGVELSADDTLYFHTKPNDADHDLYQAVPSYPPSP